MRKPLAFRRREGLFLGEAVAGEFGQADMRIEGMDVQTLPSGTVSVGREADY